MDGTTRRELARQIAGISELPLEGDELFFRTLDELKTFHSVNGRHPSPTAEAEDEARLGLWLEAQRSNERRGMLQWMCCSMLDEAFGPEWRKLAVA